MTQPTETGAADERCSCVHARHRHNGSGEGGAGCTSCGCTRFSYHWPANTPEVLANTEG